MRREPPANLQRATWAALFGLVAAAAASPACTGYCPPEVRSEDDPCFGKSGCDMVPVSPDGGPALDDDSEGEGEGETSALDGGVTSDAGVEEGSVPMRYCGCCNG